MFSERLLARWKLILPAGAVERKREEQKRFMVHVTFSICILIFFEEAWSVSDDARSHVSMHSIIKVTEYRICSVNNNNHNLNVVSKAQTKILQEYNHVSFEIVLTKRKKFFILLFICLSSCF